MALLDDIVIFDGNREAFELLMHASDAREKPLFALICGPVGSGKTTAAQARCKTPDLVSGRHLTMCHVAEIVAFFNLGEMGECFLGDIGEAEVLIIDGLEAAFEHEIGPTLVKLLLDARRAAGLDTIVISDVPPEQLDLAPFEGTLDKLRRIDVLPLDRAGLAAFARTMEKSLRPAGHDVRLADDAIGFLVDGFCHDAGEVRNAVRFLVDAQTFENGTLIDSGAARAALSSERPSEDTP